MNIERKDIGAINGIYSDFKSSIIAAGLVEQGFDVDKILILREQAGSSSAGKEIVSVEYKEIGDGSKRLIFQTNREGIYDRLPEGLFHAPASAKRARSKEAILAEIRRQNEEEMFIRRFFSLFETEIERTRIDIELSELKYDKPETSRAFVDTMLPYWPVIRLMELQTAILFVRTLPLIASIRSSYDRIAGVIASIVGYPVEIELRQRRKKPEIGFPRLSGMKLGVNAVLGGEFYDVRPDAVIKITPANAKIGEYLPGRVGRRVLEALAWEFMPAGVDFSIRVIAEPQENPLRLGDAANPCYLGVNTFLRSQ